MPFGTIVQEEDEELNRLRERLRQEWAGEQADALGPVIIETTNNLRPQSTPTHLYVFWSAWSGLSQQQRSEMMMNVYEQVRGRASALNVTLAMGLTPEEAARMGIHYATSDAA